MKKRIISLFCVLTLVFTSFSWMLPVFAKEEDENAVIVSGSDIPLILKYDEEAPFINENSPAATMHDDNQDKGWNNWSLPLGNGYFGVSAFGRTETERLQITEKTLSNPWRATGPNGESISNLGGLNNFSETYIDFGHASSAVTNYQRYLDLSSAISGVNYTYGGVNYTREYFTSYPDKALVIYLSADKAGTLDFTLRPTVPYEQSYAVMAGDKGSKTGTVTSSVSGNVGTVELAGKLGYYDVDFMGLYKVYVDSGSVTASTATHTYKDTAGVTHNDTDGTIVVSGAKSAYIVVTLGTDYELSEDVFASGESAKPTFNTNLTHTRAKVEGYMSEIDAKLAGKSFADAYKLLKDTHVEDHSELFGRVTLDLGCKTADFSAMTDDLLERYQSGEHSTYLETLIFQYGRYMLIASSRTGALPAHLQGAWNTYNIAPWASGYWHNINVQMNYWPAFSTNLAETFESYVALNEAYMKKAQSYADSVIGNVNPSEKDTNGENGWTIGVGNTAYWISSDNSPGNTGYTTQLFWDYYNYTRDEEILEQTVLPVLLEAAKFITKCVHLTDEGKYLVIVSDSPEMFVNGVWYYTEGTTYAQTFAYLSNYYTLLAAEAAGVDLKGELGGDYEILKTVLEQIDKYDPINVGLSGQIKEFREEDYYGSVGDEPNHRHISQLVGLSPGNLINANTPAWIDAALVTLEGRSEADAHGWVFAHKINLYARAFDEINAYSMLNGFIEHCAPNLWSLYNNRIFQVEANFGTTAGIAEMLMQSQNGYIELLPSLPDEWSDGSFTGLVAAGNFEVSAAWESGLLKTANITSNKGGSVSVKYPSMESARVISASGKSVSFSVTDKNVITFDTEVGETYIISGLERVEYPDAPETLAFTGAAFGPFRLACSEVSGAVGYNLYVAVENSATYELVESSSDNYFTYTPAEENKNARTTFAVTAVGSNGEESKRTLCYRNPEYTDADIVELYSTVLASGALQIVVDANDNTRRYKLWEKKGSEQFVLIDESEYPILIAKDYKDSCTYAVSVVSGFDGKESEKKLVDGEYDPNNVLLDKEFIPTPDTQDDIYKWGSGYLGFDLLTDGRYTEETAGRYSSTKGGKADATLYLGATYVLSELRIHLYKGEVASAGIEEKFMIQISSGGKWITVFDGTTQNLADFKDGSSPYVVFDLGCQKVEKIRFKAEASSDKTVTFHEILCSGVLAETYSGETNNVLDGNFIPSDATAGNIYNSSYGFENLTDGINNGETEGRFSSGKGKDVEATVDIGGEYALSELRIYVYKGEAIRAGKRLKIDLMIDGEWTTAFDGAQSDIKNHLVDRYLSFDLGYARAEKIRFYASSYDSSNTVTFYEIECSGYAVEESGTPEATDNIFEGANSDIALNAQFCDNILLNKLVVAQSGANDHIYGNNENYGYSKLTDGPNGGRFSTKRGRDIPQGEIAFDGMVDLGGLYELSTFRINYYTEGDYVNEFFGTSMQIQVYYDGSWKTVKNLTSVDGILEADSDKTNGYWLDFDLSGEKAEKIRLTVPEVNCRTNNSRSISFFEIECSGTALASGSVSDENVTANTTDGNLESYVEVIGTGSYSLEIALERPRKLTVLTIHELIDNKNMLDGKKATASDSTVIEIFKNGNWTKVYSGVSLGSGVTLFDMYGIESSRIRITFKNTRSFDGESSPRAARILEVTCDAEPEPVDLSEMKEALDKLPSADVQDDLNGCYLQNEVYERFKSYVLNREAAADDVAEYTKQINDYYKTLSSVILCAYNVSLGGDISLNFRYKVVDKDVFALYPNAYLEVRISEKDGDKITKVYFKDASVDSLGRYVFPVSLMAMQMTDSVSVKVVYDENTALEVFTTSVREYADYILSHPEMEAGYPGVGELIRAMLNYGGYAQKYFGYNTENLANEGLYTAENDPVKDVAQQSASVTVEGNATGISPVGWTLTLGSKTDIIILFDIDEGMSRSSYSAKVSGGSYSEASLSIVRIEDSYGVIIKDVEASELDTVYTVTLTNNSDASALSIELSPLGYVSEALEDSGTVNTLADLCRALCVYNGKANEYRAKNYN